MADPNAVYYERVILQGGIPLFALPNVPVVTEFVASKDLCMRLHVTGQWIVISGKEVGGGIVWVPADGNAVKVATQLPAEQAAVLYPNQNVVPPAPPTSKRSK